MPILKKQKHASNKAVLSFFLLLLSVTGYSQELINISISNDKITGYSDKNNYSEYKIYFQNEKINDKQYCSGIWQIKSFQSDDKSMWINFIKQGSESNFNFESNDKFQEICEHYMEMVKTKPANLQYGTDEKKWKKDNNYSYGKSIEYTEDYSFKISLQKDKSNENSTNQAANNKEPEEKYKVDDQKNDNADPKKQSEDNKKKLYEIKQAIDQISTNIKSKNQKENNPNTIVIGLLSFIALFPPLIYIHLIRKIKNLSNQQFRTRDANRLVGLSTTEKALLGDFINTAKKIPSTAVQSQETTLKLSTEVHEVFHHFLNKLNTIDNKIESLSTKISGNNNQSILKLEIQSKKGEIISLKNQIKLLQESKEKISSKFDDKSIAEEQLNKKVKELEADILNSNNNYEEVQSTVTGLQSTITGLETERSKAQKKAQDYKEKFNQIQTDQQQQKEKRKENLLNAIEGLRISITKCDLLNGTKKKNYISNLETVKRRVKAEILQDKSKNELSYFLAKPLELVYFCYFYGLFKELESPALKFCDTLKLYLQDYCIEIDLSLYNKETEIDAFDATNYVTPWQYLLIDETKREHAAEIIFKQMSILAMHYNNLTTKGKIADLNDIKKLINIENTNQKTVMQFSKIELQAGTELIQLKKHDL